jgi:hypothetical protein
MDNQSARICEQSLKFSLGQMLATPSLLNTISTNEIQLALERHIRGDWGLIDPLASKANDEALISGGRLLSSYRSSQNVAFHIITERGRSITIILLQKES